MSISQNLFIGPFAEWLVPEGKTEGLPTEDEEGYLFSGKLLCNVGLSLPDVIVRRGRSYHRFCYMPRKGRPGRHGRVMYFAGETADPGIQDLLDTDRQAEIGWFVKTFVKELRVLAGHFGGELAMRWGVVSWYS